MPRAIPYTEALIAAILEPLAAGEALKLICRRDGLPSADTVWRWARTRPDFAQRFKAARAAFRRQRLARRGPRQPEPDLINEICARVECGETLSGICRGLAHMPVYEVARAWVDDHPEFARRYRAAVAFRNGQRRFKPRCYNEEVAEAVCARLAKRESLQSISRDPGMPSVATLLRWRAQWPWFARRFRQAMHNLTPPVGGQSRYSRALEDAICERLAAGESLSAICRSPQMPALSTVIGWLRISPGFAQRYALARQAAHEDWDDELLAAINAAGRGGGVGRIREALRRPKPPAAIKYLP